MSDSFFTFVGDADLSASATAIGRALDVDFTERDSLYLGGDYFRSEPSWGEIVVQHNDDLGEPAEPAYPDAPTVVTIDTDATNKTRVLAAMSELGFTRVES